MVKTHDVVAEPGEVIDHRVDKRLVRGEVRLKAEVAAVKPHRNFRTPLKDKLAIPSGAGETVFPCRRVEEKREIQGGSVLHARPTGDRQPVSICR